MSQPKPQVSACKSCGASIYWAKSSTGKSIPIDAEPVEGGNVWLSISTRTGELRAKIVSKSTSLESDRNAYVSHFVTCPQSKDWRKR